MKSHLITLKIFVKSLYLFPESIRTHVLKTLFKINFIIGFLFLVTSCFAQFHKAYNWNETPIIHELSNKEKRASSVGILKKHVVEYAKSMFGDQMKIYETEHRIIRVNDDKGIARHNTVYIPMFEPYSLQLQGFPIVAS